MESAHRARLADLPDCARLLEQARREAGRRRGGRLLLVDRPVGALPDATAGTQAAALALWAACSDHVLLAGTVDGAVVGVAAGHARELGDEQLGLVDCLYVEPGARGVGVGSALAATLVACFADLGCVAVDAPALPGDRETKQRFEAAGFSARLLVLHRRLR